MTWKPSRPGRNCGLSKSVRPCGLIVRFWTNLLMTSALTSATFCLPDQTTLYSGLASGFGWGPVPALYLALAAFHCATALSRLAMAPSTVLFFTLPRLTAFLRVLASHCGL